MKVSAVVGVWVAFTLFTLATHETACTHAPSVADRAALAAEQADYAAALNHCYDDAKTYDAYEACAKTVDAKFGVKK